MCDQYQFKGLHDFQENDTSNEREIINKFRAALIKKGS